MSRSGAPSLQERIFRLLLRLLPPEFRAIYGNEMTEFFLARLALAHRDRGGWSGLRLWYRTVVDMVRTASVERWEGVRARGGPESQQIMTRDKGMVEWVHGARIPSTGRGGWLAHRSLPWPQ